MPVTKIVIFVVVFAVVSAINASKVDKKSGIFAQHHEQKCADYKAVASKCHMWKDLGFCFKHRKEMEFVCSKTCKFCDPGETHWTYTSKPDENAKTKTVIETPNHPSPVVEVMGKKKALYLSSNDIAGMLQTLSSQNLEDTEKPTPKPKELAVIQGRIQKVEPVVIKTNAKGVMTIKPTISVAGKLQPAPKAAEKEDSGGKDEGKNDAKPEDKNKEGQNTVENKLLGLMSQIIRGGAGDKEKKPKDSANEKKKVEPANMSEIMKILQNLKLEKMKKEKENTAKDKQATEQKPPNATGAEPKVNTTENQASNAKNKALLAAMKLFKAVGPVGSASKGNQSALMEQLTAAAEEAGVALKLLNKTGAVDKLKEANVPSGGGDVMYNVKLLQEELNKANKKNQSNVATSTPVLEPTATANTSKMAVVNVSSSNPQLSEFILRLQDSITNPQGKVSGPSISMNGRGGVAMRKDEGKPTLSEIIPFNIKVDDAESDTTGNLKSETPTEVPRKTDTKVTYESDEEKIMKILDGLDQNDKPKTVQDRGSSTKDIVMQIREAYDDLGEIVNGVEIQEGIKKKKKKEDEDNEEGTEQSTEEKKKKEEKKEEKKDEKDSKDEKEKKGNEEEKKKKKKKKDGDEDEVNDAFDVEEYFDPSSKPKPKKKKPLTKEQHLQQVLSLIKMAGHHLEMIGAKRVKMAGKTQDPSNEDASIRSANSNNNQEDWKTLATRLARQLGLVLTNMAEKDEKYKAERGRLQSVLAALAQTELSAKHGNTDDDTSEDGDEEGDDDYNQDEDRSKIIHNMATKLLRFSKTISAVQKSSEGKTVRKKKKVLHKLISRYRSLVTKIMNNWKKLKGKKKSRIPRLKGKRGEIVRGGKGNHTTKAVHENPTVVKVNQTEDKTKQTAQDKQEKVKPMASKPIESASLPATAETKKTNKKTEKKGEEEEKEETEKVATKKEIITPVADDEQDVIEIVHK